MKDWCHIPRSVLVFQDIPTCAVENMPIGHDWFMLLFSITIVDYKSVRDFRNGDF